MSKKSKKERTPSKFSMNGIEKLSREELLKLIKKLFIHLEIEAQSVREIEDKQEALSKEKLIDVESMREIELYQEKLTRNKNIDEQFTREVEKAQDQLAWFQKISQEFIREIETNQQKLSLLDNVEHEFVREIEKSQEKIIADIRLLHTFIIEVEENQEKMAVFAKNVAQVRDDLQKLESAFTKICNCEDFVVLDELLSKFDISLLKSANDLTKALIKAR